MLFPLSAIDHIEVLRDGAAAQYGSDAIAGVINIVLKGGIARPEVTANTGLSAGSFVGNRAQNVFDVFPDRNTTVNSFNGIQTFPSQSPFGMNGRTLYVRAGRTF